MFRTVTAALYNARRVLNDFNASENDKIEAARKIDGALEALEEFTGEKNSA